jgi:Uri superfamily endonuclease
MSQTGTYVLLLYLSLDITLEVGNLGQVNFPAGFYTYVDSAFSAGGLPARLKEHLTRTDKPQRHIDYLQQIAELEEIWLSAGSTTREHVWAELLTAIPGGAILVEGFGSTDCACESHLTYFDVRPGLEDFVVGARYRFPDDTIIRAFAKRGDQNDDRSS